MTHPPLLDILVVEDGQNSRDLLCEMIALLGHHPYGVGTAEEAINALRTKRFDVLLTDINLPAMSGIEIAKIAATTWPRIKIVFASGFGFLLTDSDKTDFAFTLLPKPYSFRQVKDLIAQLSSALAAEASSRNPDEPVT